MSWPGITTQFAFSLSTTELPFFECNCQHANTQHYQQQLRLGVTSTADQAKCPYIAITKYFMLLLPITLDYYYLVQHIIIIVPYYLTLLFSITLHYYSLLFYIAILYYLTLLFSISLHCYS